MNGTGYFASGSNGGTTNSRVYIYGGTYNGTNVISIDGSNGLVDATGFRIKSDTNNRFESGAIVLRNTSPTIYFQDTDHNSAMLHCNSNILYVLRGATDSTSWSQVNGAWPVEINLTNNTMTVGGILQTTGTSNDMRAPIFYDSNNTSYYVDPASTSQFNAAVFLTNPAIKMANPYMDWRKADNTRTGYIQFTDAGNLNIDNEAGDYQYIFGKNNSWCYIYGRNGYAVLDLRGSGTNTGYIIFENGTNGERFRLYGDNNRVLFMSGNNGSTNHFSFDASGNFIALANITAYGTPSDLKFKTNVQDLPNALDKVLKLRPVTFDWREETPQNSQVNLVNDVGFIAQEVQEVLPDLVRDFDGSLSLRERGIVPYLVQAIKELQEQINELKRKVC
jgi:hypothetical protein